MIETRSESTRAAAIRQVHDLVETLGCLLEVLESPNPIPPEVLIGLVQGMSQFFDCCRDALREVELGGEEKRTAPLANAEPLAGGSGGYQYVTAH